MAGIVEQVIDKSTVFDYLQEKSAEWDRIGRAFGVDSNFRDGLCHDGSLDNDARLEKVIDIWFERGSASDLTWPGFISILKDRMKFNDVARKVEEYWKSKQGPVNELDNKLKDLVDWERFAIHLPKIYSADIQKIVKDHKSTDTQKFHLYSLWLNRYPDASWNDVVEALKKTGNHTMAMNIEKQGIVTNTQWLSDCTGNSTGNGDAQHLSSSTGQQPAVAKCVKAYRDHCEGHYTRIKTPTYDKKPSPSITEFIQLILVRQKKNSKQDEKALLKHKMEGDTKAIKNLRKKSTLSIDQIGEFMKGKPQVLVLIKGDPGVGKTTLAWELCKGWTEGRLLQTWDIVLLVQLRAKNIREANTLQSLIDPCNTHTGLSEYIQEKNGAGLMLIFDGLDELSDTQRQENSFFMRLLQGEMLTKTSIIVTTRPSAMKLIPEVFIDNLDQHIEIHGFEEEAIDRYIECKFKDNSDIMEAFKDYVSSHHFIYSLMYVPLHCALITDLYEDYCNRQREFAPKTLTELYTCLVCCLIWRSTGQEIRRISELGGDLKHKFTELARIAAMGIENKQYVFDDVDADLDQLGLLQRVELATGYFETSESCSFLHLTLQEYLAAYYWSTQKDVSKLFDSKGILPVKDHMMGTKKKHRVSFRWPVVHFYCGLKGIKGTPLEPIIKEHCTILDKEDESITDNYLYLLFESCTNHDSTTSEDHDSIISSAFSTTRVSNIRVKSSKVAYVTGYCIARANESVKWEIEMDKSVLIRNLVHGIEHGKLMNIKGSVIKGIHVKTGTKDCDVFQFFSFLEEIHDFFENFDLRFKSDLKRFCNSAMEHTVDLTTFSYMSYNFDNSFAKSLFSTLVQFKSLKAVYVEEFLGRCITDTTVDKDRQVHIQVNNTDEYCFPGPSLSEVCQSLPHDCHHRGCIIPYVMVRHFVYICSFEYLDHGYELLPDPIKNLFNPTYRSSTSQSKYTDQIKSVMIFDCQHRFILGEYFAIHFYNFDEMKWIVLNLKARTATSGLEGILVTPDNVELLMDILKKSEMKTAKFKLVGDSDYLQPLVQFITNDLKGSLMEIPKNRLQLAVTLDTEECKESSEIIEMNNRDLIKWSVRFDLDRLHLITQQCSINKVVSFKIERLPSSNQRLNFEKLKTLLNTALLHCIELNLSDWSPNDDEAKVIHDGLVNNHGLEVVVFGYVKSGLELLYEGLRNHSTLNILIIRLCSAASVHMLIPVVCSVSLKHLVLEHCDISIDDYRSLHHHGLANNNSIEEVAIREDEDVIRAILTDLPSLNIRYKLIMSKLLWKQDSIQPLVDEFSLSDTSQVVLLPNNEFHDYIKGLRVYSI